MYILMNAYKCHRKTCDVISLTTVGADFMTVIGSIAPRDQKVVGAMPPSRPTGILLCHFFQTVK